MTRLSKFARSMARALFGAGTTLCMVLVPAQVMLQMEMSRFEESQVEATGPAEAGPALQTGSKGKEQSRADGVDYSLWSAQRIRAYADSLTKEVGPPLAVLRIPRLNLEVPVLDGTDELTMNRGVGRIAGTAFPGEEGNIGIAGHRDGFFRGLKDVRAGDRIELSTTKATAVYIVKRLRITSPRNLRVLQPSSKPSLTLVTCYPFYYAGRAPQRYIVQARRHHIQNHTNAPFSVQ